MTDLRKTFKYIAIAAFAVAIWGGISASASAASEIGKIKRLTGEAVITRGDQVMPAELGAVVLLQDIIETGKEGGIGLLFVDNTRLSLGSNSRVTLDEYVYQSANKQGSFLAKLWRGTLGYLSGNIAKNSPGNVKIQTPLATIGVRGTSFVISLYD